MRAAGPGLQAWAWRLPPSDDRSEPETWPTVASAMLFDQGGMLGLMNMIVAPRQRGLGMGHSFLAALLELADTAGQPVWLQVQGDNTPGLALYRAAGFTPLYSYSYWCPVSPY